VRKADPGGKRPSKPGAKDPKEGKRLPRAPVRDKLWLRQRWQRPRIAGWSGKSALAPIIAGFAKKSSQSQAHSGLIISRVQGVYKGCPSDAHWLNKEKSYVHPVSIPCTPLVHGSKVGRKQAGFSELRIRSAEASVEDWLGGRRVMGDCFCFFEVLGRIGLAETSESCAGRGTVPKWHSWSADWREGLGIRRSGR